MIELDVAGGVEMNNMTELVERELTINVRGKGIPGCCKSRGRVRVVIDGVVIVGVG
jgi:hypothetical protein